MLLRLILLCVLLFSTGELAAPSVNSDANLGLNTARSLELQCRPHCFSMLRSMLHGVTSMSRVEDEVEQYKSKLNECEHRSKERDELFNIQSAMLQSMKDSLVMQLRINSNIGDQVSKILSALGETEKLRLQVHQPGEKSPSQQLLEQEETIRNQTQKLEEQPGEEEYESQTQQTEQPEEEEIENQSEKYPFQLELEELRKRNTTFTPSSCRHFIGSSDIHTISVPGESPSFPVPCESRVAGPGWTVIQRRLDGAVSFERPWVEYKDGFGDLSGEFFLGLQKLHWLTEHRRHELYIELQDFNGSVAHAHYDNFLVGSEKEAFELKSLGEFSGTAGDSLTYHLHRHFSIPDEENIQSETELCPPLPPFGGWWFRDCAQSSLNGRYVDYGASNDTTQRGIMWTSWWPSDEMALIKSVKIMIRELEEPKANTD